LTKFTDDFIANEENKSIECKPIKKWGKNNKKYAQECAQAVLN
jgi:hypothetical protein